MSLEDYSNHKATRLIEFLRLQSRFNVVYIAVTREKKISDDNVQPIAAFIALPRITHLIRPMGTNRLYRVEVEKHPPVWYFNQDNVTCE
jgi:hypothetical protein